MTHRLRLPKTTWEMLIRDLRRPHPVVHERLGLLACKTGSATGGAVVFLPIDYTSMPDNLYETSESDLSVLIGSKAINFAMSYALKTKLSCLLVHLHDHNGVPRLSNPDKFHGPNMVRALQNSNRWVSQGYVVLSRNACAGLVATPGSEPALSKFVTSIISNKLEVR